MDIELYSGLPWSAIAHHAHDAFIAALEAIHPHHKYPNWQELSLEDRIAFEAAVRQVEQCANGEFAEDKHWATFAQIRYSKAKPASRQ